MPIMDLSAPPTSPLRRAPAVFFANGTDDDCDGDSHVSPESKDIQVQLVISLGLGVVAFLAFCTLRPRWKSLYAARRRNSTAQMASLPVLPDSFLGWLPALYRITEDQVLSSAGLDAFVFLAFFKMSLQLFGVMFFFAAVVLEPINRHFLAKTKTGFPAYAMVAATGAATGGAPHDDPDEDDSWKKEKGHLWAYLVFVYFFTILTYRIMNRETFRIIKIRQEYLGSQATVTDRTFCLSGIPKEFRTEAKIKALIEKLEIGRVESVTVCCKWKALDALVARRAALLRTLEETWSAYLAQQYPRHAAKALLWLRRRQWLRPLAGRKTNKKNKNKTRAAAAAAAASGRNASLRALVGDEGDDGHNGPHDNSTFDVEANAGDEGESDRLLAADEQDDDGDTEGADDDDDDDGNSNDPDATAAFLRSRPQVRIWYGPLRLKSRKTDAIDYYEEKLRRLDEQVRAARQAAYEATDLAFVTMDSVAACQMAIQAVLDPRPGELLARLAPAPSDVIWHNTYASRTARRARAWTITVFITVLSIVWLVPVASLASLLSLCTIQKWAPGLAAMLSQHEVTKALVQTGLPTAVVSLLNVAVPYLYEYLSNRQGMLSQGDVELSIISKNFFFTFFNIFLVFTVFGTATRFWTVLRDSLRDTTYVAYALAREVQRLNIFYLNFIMLQAFALFPLRLLEFGAVALYPFNRLAARTPRARAQIATPPTFSYGFFLPTALLVFILCLVYSVLPRGFLVLLLGCVYFAVGYLVYKYQLLYAMDQPQHATGGAWRIICYRILLGLAVFHLTMSGYLGANKAYVQATLVIPLFVFTVWYMYYWRERFEPLTLNIALLSVRRDGDASPLSDDDVHNGLGNLTFARRRRLRRTSTLDENREKGLRFVNPSLVAPLEQPWIDRDPPPLVPSAVYRGQDDDDDMDNDDSSSALASPASAPPFAGFGSLAGSAAAAVAAAAESSRADAAGRPRPSRSTSSSFSLGDTHIWRDDGVPSGGSDRDDALPAA